MSQPSQYFMTTFSVQNHGLFTVVIPTYNRAGMVCDALESVKKQTYRPVEIVVVDDGSRDETKRCVAEWIDLNPEPAVLDVRYFYQSNSGPAAARNRGIAECRGEYVQFLDSDDTMHPDRLQRLVDVFEQTGADFIQTGFESWDASTGETISQHFARPEANQVELALQGYLWANTLRSAFRRSLIEKIGPWDTKMTCFEDRDYVERAVVTAVKPVAIREILASARRGGSTRVSDKLRTYEGRTFRVLCEERLAEATRDRTDISLKARSDFASRIYALGFRCNASGWPDLARRCGNLAESMNVELDGLGKRRRAVFRAGPMAARAYGWAHRVKARWAG